MPTINLTDLPSGEEIEGMVSSITEEADETVTEEQAEQIKAQLEEERAELDIALSYLGNELEQEFGEFARKRERKEAEWLDAIMQCRKDAEYYNRKEQYEQGATKRLKSPKINITSHKINMSVARMLDIQLPLGGDFNFRIDPEPDADMEAIVGDETPMPEDPEVSRGAVAKSILSEALDKAKRMQLTIERQFIEGDFGRITRESMYDWARLGTAITKGPCIRPKTRKSYTHIPDSEGGMQSEVNREVEYDAVPERVDPLYFYPDPECLVPHRLEKAYTIYPASRSDMIKLAKNDSFMRERIRRVLDKKPDGETDNKVFSLTGIIDSDYALKNKYIVKTYHGPIDKEVLKHMDLGIPDIDDELLEVYGEVWFVQGEVIRVSVSPLDGDDTLPFQIVVWEKDDTSLFGHGMAYKMRDQQIVGDAAWGMLLDNAGLSAAPQLALNKEMIKPANGRWDIEAGKIWFMTEYGQNVNDAIQFVNVPNNQESLARVIEMALQFADIESETPMINQSMLPQANNASGMGLVLTEANVSQRELSMAWDKYIIVPLVERFVDYNMQYSSDPKIKGDFKVRVGAATQRIDNQIIAQDCERILGMAQQDPMYQVQIDPQYMFRKWASATRVGPEVLRSPEEVAAEVQKMEQQAAEQGPDPEAVRAQAVMMREEARQAEMQAQQQLQEQEAAIAAEQREFDRQAKIAEFEDKEKDRQLRIFEKEADRELAMIQMADKRQITLAQLTKDLEIASMSKEASLAGKAIDFEKFRQQIEMKERFGTGVSQT